MGQRGLNDEADAGAGQHGEQRCEHRHGYEQHEHAIGRIGGVEQAKGHEVGAARQGSMGSFSPCRDRAIPIRESWGWWRKTRWPTSSSSTATRIADIALLEKPHNEGAPRKGSYGLDRTT